MLTWTPHAEGVKIMLVSGATKIFIPKIYLLCKLVKRRKQFVLIEKEGEIF